MIETLRQLTLALWRDQLVRWSAQATRGEDYRERDLNRLEALEMAEERGSI